MTDAERPAWLEPGATVLVLPASSRSQPPYAARVLGVEWRWLVFLEGWPGAVHPGRCRPLPPEGGEAEPAEERPAV